MKKLFSFAIAAALVIQTPFSVKASSVFVDIDTVPWAGAATSIEQAYNYGLLSGYVVDGQRYAKPNSNLAYSEATQLAYSIMKVYTGQDVHETVTTKWAQIMKAYEIPTWLHPAASYCLEEGFLDPIHLSKLKDDTYKVTREEVGVLFGKALASVYGVGTNANLPYKDSNVIQQISYPYLALLFEKEIMVGDADGNFRPLDKINRAEVAVLTVQAFESIYRAQLELNTPTAGVVSGTVTTLEHLSTGDILLIVTDSTGQSKNVTVNSINTKITYKDEPTLMSQLGVNDIVTVYYSGTDATSISINESSLGIEHKVIYNLSDVNSNLITVVDGNGNKYTYNVDDDVIVYLDNLKSSVESLKLATYEYDYVVTLTIEQNNLVTRIEAVESSTNPLTGDLYYLSENKAIIEIGTKKYEYNINNSDVIVSYNGSNYSFDAIKSEYTIANPNVTITLNSQGYVSSININYMDDATNGTLDYMNSRSLKLVSRGEYYAYMIDSNAKISIDGAVCEIEDVVNTYKDRPYYVSLSLNSSNDVVVLSAITKNIGNAAGTLVSLTNNVVGIENEGIRYEYTVANSSYTDVNIDGKTASFETLKNEYMDYDVTIQLTFDANGEVTKMTCENLSANVGKMKKIEPKIGRITITAIGVDYVYTAENDMVVEINNVTYEDIYDLEDKFDDATWANRTMYVELDLSSGGYIEGIYATISGSAVDDDYSVDNDDIDEIVTGEYYSYSSRDILVTVSGKTTSYDISFSDLDDFIAYNDKAIGSDELKTILNSYSINDEKILKIKLYLDEDDNILYLKADDRDSKEYKGYLVGIDEKNGYIEIYENETDKVYSAWELSSNCIVYYDLNRYYDEDSYSVNFDGLIDLYDDALYYKDDVYIQIELNSSGKVVGIDAEIN